jgi:hypothetical protein
MRRPTAQLARDVTRDRTRPPDRDEFRPLLNDAKPLDPVRGGGEASIRAGPLPTAKRRHGYMVRLETNGTGACLRHQSREQTFHRTGQRGDLDIRKLSSRAGQLGGPIVAAVQHQPGAILTGEQQTGRTVKTG